MMLERYIQIAILVILALLLWRDNRIEKRREAEKDRNLASSFNNLRDCLAEGLKSAVDEIKHQTAYALTNCVDRTNNTLGAIRQAVASLQSTQSISSILSTSSISSIPSILTELKSLQTPLKQLGEAQANNVIKEGEANRILRNKLQEKREILAQMNSQMSSLNSQLKSAQAETAQVKAAAQTYMQQLAAEITMIRSWMNSKGMPLASLDKALSLEFKNCVPSWEYQKALDQRTLNDSVAVGANCGSPAIPAKDSANA